MTTTTPHFDSILDGITDVFRSSGFDGASLSLLSKATGLGRGSLYHHFPGGKEDMAVAVLERMAVQFQGVLQPLSESGSLPRRIKRTADRLGDFYGDGTAWCLVETLSLGEPPKAVSRRIAAALEGWIAAFAAAAKEAGAAPKAARRRAERAVTGLQGGLILARATGQPGPFRAALAELPQTLAG